MHMGDRSTRCGRSCHRAAERACWPKRSLVKKARTGGSPTALLHIANSGCRTRIWRRRKRGRMREVRTSRRVVPPICAVELSFPARSSRGVSRCASVAFPGSGIGRRCPLTATHPLRTVQGDCYGCHRFSHRLSGQPQTCPLTRPHTGPAVLAHSATARFTSPTT